MSSGRPIVLGRYELHAPIARGGMATVYFGRVRGAVGFSRTVAIKRLHPQMACDAAFRAMFIDEARLVARIRHPNVVQIVDVVAEEEELFLVMDYVHGESLDGLIHRPEPAPIPPAIATAIFADVLHGLHAAHEATGADGAPLGVVHRDVTPHNILVGVDGSARIADFGIAKASARQQWTKEGQIKGKLAYLAPEQFEGSDAARSADVYAAAASLHEALSGRVLFGGDNEANIMTRIMLGVTAPPSAFAPGIPPALDEVVMRGLEMRARDRFQTAREMALALEQSIERPRASAVSAWVETRAAVAIAKRSAIIATIERTPILESVPPPPGGADPARGGLDATRAAARADGRESTAVVDAPGGNTKLGLGVAAPLAAAMPRDGAGPGGASATPDSVSAKPDSVYGRPDGVSPRPDSVYVTPDTVVSGPKDDHLARGDNQGDAAPRLAPLEEDDTPVATTIAGLPSRRSRALLLALALVLLGGGVGFGAWRVRGSRARTSASSASAALPSGAGAGEAASASAADVRTTSASVEPPLGTAPPSPSPAPIAPGAASSSTTHAPGRSVKPPPAASKTPPPASSASADECNPPYVRDANGAKVYKRRCL